MAGQLLAPSNSLDRLARIAVRHAPCRTQPRHVPFFRRFFLSGCPDTGPMPPVFPTSFKLTLTRWLCVGWNRKPSYSGPPGVCCAGVSICQAQFSGKNTQVPLPLRRPLRRPDELGSLPGLTESFVVLPRPSPAVLSRYITRDHFCSNCKVFQIELSDRARDPASPYN